MRRDVAGAYWCGCRPGLAQGAQGATRGGAVGDDDGGAGLLGGTACTSCGPIEGRTAVSVLDVLGPRLFKDRDVASRRGYPIIAFCGPNGGGKSAAMVASTLPSRSAV